jgi:hypothetical protein
MNKHILLATAALIVPLAAPPGEVYAHDKLVCYALEFEGDILDVRLKLDVKKHSPLSEVREEKAFGHARQTAFSVHGKVVLGAPPSAIMTPIDGTVITAKPTKDTTGQIGAHMGLISQQVRSDGNFSAVIECTTIEVSEVPDTWDCFVALVRSSPGY